MSSCELIEKCIFFNDQMANMPSTAEIYKMKYCQGSSDECARFMVRKAKGGEFVPADLYPNQTDRALAIINS
jgi:hypothetical protein